MNTEYLFSQDFIDSSKERYDIVLVESELKNETHTIQSIVLHYLNNSKNILIVLDISSIDSILHVVSKSDCNVCIINPNM